MQAKIERVLERFEQILTGCAQEPDQPKFTRYAVTNFRGGIGKSTLAFNLAWELTRQNSALLLDLCSQRNFSQALLGDDISDQGSTIYDALLQKVANASNVDANDLMVSVKPYCPAFKSGKDAFLVPG